MSTVADNIMQITIENPNIAAMGIGERIKFARERQGVSQTELAEAVGIRQSSVADIENGQTKKPRKPTLVSIAKFLKSDLGENWIKDALKTEFVPSKDESFDALLDARIRRIVQEEMSKHTASYHPYDLTEDLKMEKKKEKKELPLPSQKKSVN